MRRVYGYHKRLFRLPPIYPIIDGALLAQRGVRPVEAAEALLEAGASMLQFRWKDHFSRQAFAEAEAVAAACRTSGALLIVNDRADIAILLGAGLHVGQDDIPAADARRLIGPDRLLGLSTHNETQFRAAAAEPVDYIAIGPIFATKTKSKADPVLGTAELARLAPMSEQPLVAIGGVTLETAREVLAAGADIIAVAADLYPEPCSKELIRERFRAWMKLATPEQTGGE